MGLIAIALLGSSVRNVSAQTLDERAKEDLRDAEAVSKRHRDELMKIPHVSVVTAEIDPRDDAVILVEVDDQKNVDEVMRKLPPRIEGFPVEVDEGGGETSEGDGGVDLRSHHFTFGAYGSLRNTP